MPKKVSFAVNIVRPIYEFENFILLMAGSVAGMIGIMKQTNSADGK